MKKNVKKAIIPVAGLGTRFLPITKTIPKEMLPILNKPTIHYIVEEAVNSGIEEIIFIISSKKNSLSDYFDRQIDLETRLIKDKKIKEFEEIKKISYLAKYIFVRQYEQLGLGHAILMAENLINNEPFALLLGDEIIDNDSKPALKQIIEIYDKTNKSVLGVQNVSDEMVSNYGIIESKDNNLIDKIIEKPNPNETNSRLSSNGRYVFNNEIFKYLKEISPNINNGEIQLTDAIEKMINDKNDIYFKKIDGKRFDLGSVDGFVKAQIHFYEKFKK